MTFITIFIRIVVLFCHIYHTLFLQTTNINLQSLIDIPLLLKYPTQAVNILDDNSGLQREPTTADFVKFVQLVETLSQLDAQSTAFVCRDVQSGINMISGAGMIDFLRCQSFENMISDTELLAIFTEVESN